MDILKIEFYVLRNPWDKGIISWIPDVESGDVKRVVERGRWTGTLRVGVWVGFRRV